MTADGAAQPVGILRIKGESTICTVTWEENTKPLIDGTHQHNQVAQLPLEVGDLPHQLELLDDLLEVVIGRQRVDLLPHPRRKVLPRRDRELRALLAPLRQMGQHQLQEAGCSRKALRR